MPTVEDASISDDGSRKSSFIAKLVEHIFASEVLQEVFYSFDGETVDVLHGEVDAFGYDLVFECKGIVRHVQLKTTKVGGKAGYQKVNIALAEKPCGCVIWAFHQQVDDRMKLSYRVFGSAAGQPLPPLDGFNIGKHTKGDAGGVKNERRAIREIPKSAFTTVSTITELVEWLFGLKQSGGNPNLPHDRPKRPSNEPSIGDGDDVVLSKIRALKRASQRSWPNLRLGCLDLSGKNPAHGTKKVGASSRAFAKKASEITGLNYEELLRLLDRHGL